MPLQVTTLGLHRMSGPRITVRDLTFVVIPQMCELIVLCVCAVLTHVFAFAHEHAGLECF